MATFRSDLKFDPPLAELRVALKELDATLPRALNKVTKKGAEVVSTDARGRATGLGRQAAAAARQIKPAGVAAGASVTLTRSTAVPFALAALLGMNRRTGWYADGRFDGAAGRQAPPWMGTGWTVGGADGPRAINPAIAAKSPEMIRFLEAELSAFAAKHFPQ